jgi:GNAT superfamily N-acetyltransferase
VQNSSTKNLCKPLFGINLPQKRYSVFMSSRADGDRFTLLDRPLRPEEAQLISEAIRETPNILGYSPQELLAISSCLIAEAEGGELAGVCVVKSLSRQWSEMAFLIVLPAHRKKGVGTALFRKAFLRLSSQGVTILCISREPSVLRLMDEAGMQYLPEWRLPLAVHLAKIRHYSSLYRFREGFRKIPLYQNQPPFQYAVKENG